MNLFPIIVNLLGICIIAVSISLVGFVHPIDASHYEVAKPTTTPLGYSGNQEYKVYLQVIVRDNNDQLVSVTESINTWRIDTFFPDDTPAPLWIDTVFYNTLMNNYQTVIIDGIEYEKAEYYNAHEQELADSYLWLCADAQVYGKICMKSFYARAPYILLEEGDIRTEKWTILRNMS